MEAILCKERASALSGHLQRNKRSAQVWVHLAMATQPTQILAKPGMGVDEGYMIVYNEMQRILATAKAKKLI